MGDVDSLDEDGGGENNQKWLESEGELLGYGEGEKRGRHG